MKSFFTSFRGRLTLWSMIVLAVALASFSIVLGYANLNRLSQQIDRELADRGRRMGRPGGPPGMPGPMQGQGPGFPSERQNGQAPPSFGDDEADRFAALRRPRFIDLQGRPSGPMSGDGVFDPSVLDRAFRGEELYSTAPFGRERLRVFTMPWRQDGRIIGAVQFARDLREYDQLRQSQLLTLLTLAPLALLVTAIGAFFLAGQALKPIAQMRSAAEAIGEGDLSQRLPVRGQDELASLALAFNEMSAKLELSFAEQKAAYEALQEAYESQRRFTADASHELRTPLARLQLATSSALAGPPEGHRPALETADKAAQQMARLVKQLLTLARADAGQLGLRHDVMDLRLVASNSANACGRQVDVDLASAPVCVSGDEDHLERVIGNLLENACRHTAADGTIKLSVKEQGGKAVVEVRDSGEGIAPEHLPHLTERFYRIDGARSREDGGCGLGLAICKSIVEAHDGEIRIASEKGKGTIVEITLPLK